MSYNVVVVDDDEIILLLHNKIIQEIGPRLTENL
jgi:hypothetical protein